eukprot:359250-Lingulodinium_polyedra.AAC.1
MQCYAMLCHAVLWCSIAGGIVLYHVMQCYAMLCYGLLPQLWIHPCNHRLEVAQQAGCLLDGST